MLQEAHSDVLGVDLGATDEVARHDDVDWQALRSEPFL